MGKNLNKHKIAKQTLEVSCKSSEVRINKGEVNLQNVKNIFESLFIFLLSQIMVLSCRIYNV